MAKPKPKPTPTKPTAPSLYGTLDPAIAGSLIAQGTPIPESYNAAPAPDQPSASGGGTAPVPTDWSIVLGTKSGLSQDDINQLNNIWMQSGGDPSTSVPLAVTYIQGTQWFKDNYPGYFSGLNNGLYGDIRGYVSYQNDLNNLYQQYYQRAPTGSEISNYVSSGKSINRVGSELQSSAMQGTLSDPMKALFSSDELKAYTDERSGIDSAQGQKILNEANLFTQVSPLFQNFYGRTPTRDELTTLLANGTDPNQVAQQFKAAGYLNAINPVLKGIFSDSELQMMANEASGADTGNGKQLLDMANLATSLNEVYQVHYGAPVTRDELNSAYTQGYTAQHVDAMLASGDYANSLPDSVKALFTPDELKLAGGQAAGASSSSEGETMLNILKQAPTFAALANQYGQPLTSDQLKGYYNSGFSAQDYGMQLQGQAWVAANSKDVQQAEGAFGDGQLTSDQLGTLGSEKAGLDTTQGAALNAAYQKALGRMNGAFQGAMARSGGFTNTQARKAITSDSSDVAA